MEWWRWRRDLMDCLSDRRCPGCMGRVPREREVCAACDAMVPRSGSVLCLHCLHADPAEPPAAPSGESGASGACPAHGSRRLALVGPRYEPPLDRILHALKYDGARRLVPWIASLVPELPDPAGTLGREGVLVPVPLHPARHARRGFDQALLLAEDASARWGIPVVHPLERVRDHEPQARLDPDRRRINVRGAFRVARPSIIRARPVLLLDDVVTTGSTLLEAAAALQDAGAAWILGLAPTHGGLAEGPEPMVQGAVVREGRVW